MLEKNIGILSGGEKQLVNLFVCMSKDASVYLLDEPLANVYPSLKQNVYSILKNLSSENKIVIIISHETDFLPGSITYELKKK